MKGFTDIAKQNLTEQNKTLAYMVMLVLCITLIMIWQTIYSDSLQNNFPLFILISTSLIALSLGIGVYFTLVAELRTSQLKENEALLRSMANSIPTLVWMSGTDMLCHYFNQSWLNFTGNTLEQERGDGWAKGVHPEDLSFCTDNYIKAFNQRRPFESEYRLKRADGEYRWMLDKGTPHYNQQGKFLGYIGACIDITERKNLYHDLERNEQRYRDLYNNTPVMLHSIDRNGNIIGVSNFWLKHMGYERQEVLGRSPTDFLTEVSKKYAIETALPTLMKNGSISNVSYQMVKKNGDIIDVILSAISEKDIDGNIERCMAVINDVTDSNITQAALAENKERLQLAINSGGIGIWDWYIEENKLVWNENMYNMFGTNSDTFHTNYSTFINCVHPEDREQVNHAVRITLDQKEPYSLEYRVMWHDGSVHYIKAMGKIITDANDTPIRMTGTCIDITKEKIIANALKENQKRFELAVEGVYDGIWDWPDINKDEEYWSPQFKKLLGYEENEIQAGYKKFTELLHPEDHPRVMDAVNKHFEDGEPYAIEYRLKTKQEDYRWFIAKGNSIKNSETESIRMTGSIRDIHDKKMNAKALESLYTITNNDSLSLNKKIDQLLLLAREYLNLETAIVSRVSHKIYMIKYISSYDNLINPDETFDLDDIYCEQTLKTNNLFAVHDTTEIEINKNHEKFQLTSYIGSPITVNQKIYGTINLFSKGKRQPFTEDEKTFVRLAAQWIGNEITRHKQLSSLINTEKTLEETINELTESNMGLDHFAHIASHDLQEPLRTITNYTGLLKDRHQDKLDEEAKQYIGISADAAIRMQSLVDGLLQYCEPGSQSEKLEPINTNEIIDYVKSNLKDSIEQSETTISYNTLPTITSSQTKLTNLFENLISNAIKYQEPDNPPKIRIESAETMNEWVFKIIDNGIGIKNEYFEKIFLPFKRLHSKDEYTGTGIGLAICKKTIENIGGRIWVKSKPGQGSQFCFSIPKQNLN